ncbi:MAG: phosphatase PAP2 family protein [candidate division KSB1 bacterium]|nr:phosphatase PAP2 family protein [candidate division KSB1 bacterium]MDZ7300851.1 phosphatase PAP2 family protein [candidate division KSB1 bacterium]MDZ7309878.1 phosphatase PAP2 family protein [candidate division KSB1 bacterium]
MTWTELRHHLQHPDHKWKIYVLLGVMAYFVAINQIIKVRPDHIFLALVLFSFVLGKQRARRFLIDWLPFVLFWIGYDMMRGIADSVRGTIHIVEPYRWELALFGNLSGEIPPFLLQRVREAVEWGWLRKLIDVLAANFYTAHFALPLLLGWVFWHTTNDRPMFYKFVYTLTILNVLALLTFMAYPAAPPWYVYNYGFSSPEPNSSFWAISAGNLIDVDRLLGVKFFTTLWDSFNANHFAAIPSLHGAYPIVLSFFAFKKFRWNPWLLCCYPAAVWFSAVYLNHHYIIDLIIGGLYVMVAYFLATRLAYPLLFARFIEPRPEPADLVMSMADRVRQPAEISSMQN